MDKIWSSVLDKLTSGPLHTGKCSYRVDTGIYKSAVKGTIRYTCENHQHINNISGHQDCMRSLREWVEIVKKSNNERGLSTLEKSGWGNAGGEKKG